MPDATLTFQRHLIDTIDFHRDNDGLTYAAAIGVLAMVQHRLLTEVIEDTEDDPT